MTTGAAANPVLYQIVLADNASDVYTFGVPNSSDTPQVVYRSLPAAQAAIQEFSRKFETFIPVAYGEAYPYEGTTFEEYLQKKGAAPYGWAVIPEEDEERPVRVGVFLLALRLGA
jgi:hypothetical protein